MPTWFNSNTFHNVANILTAIVSGLTVWLISTGCILNAATGAFDCSHSWVKPVYSLWIILGIQGAKMLVNLFRDGLSGLVKPQPPVQS